MYVRGPGVHAARHTHARRMQDASFSIENRQCSQNPNASLHRVHVRVYGTLDLYSTRYVMRAIRLYVGPLSRRTARARTLRSTDGSTLL